MQYLTTLQGFFAPYLDTVKDFCYLFLGIGAAFLFWDSAEKHWKRGIQTLHPVWFLIMAIWGASGFFFLGFIPQLLLRHVTPRAQSLDNFLTLLFTAVPDWDLPIYVSLPWLWSQTAAFHALNWILSSIIVPILLIFCTKFIPLFYPRLRLSTYRHLNSFFSAGIGLSLGVSAHLTGDLILSFIPRGDIGISIYGFSNPVVFGGWLVLNIFLGIFIPCLFLLNLNSNHKRAS